MNQPHGGREPFGDQSLFQNSAPLPSFDYAPTTVFAGDTVSFSDRSTDPDGDGLSYRWSIAGALSSERNPTHVFSDPGSFTVTLAVTDEFGASASTSQTIVVQPGDGTRGFGPGTAFLIIVVAAALAVGVAISVFLLRRRRPGAP